MVGWSWEEVILALIEFLVPPNHGNGPDYLVVRAKWISVIAVAVLGLGYLLDWALGVYRRTRIAHMRASLGEGEAVHYDTELVVNPMSCEKQ